MPQVQLLIEEYCVKMEADRGTLQEQVDAVNTRISAKSTILFHAAARSEKLKGECEQVSSLIGRAEAAIVRAEAELA